MFACAAPGEAKKTITGSLGESRLIPAPQTDTPSVFIIWAALRVITAFALCAALAEGLLVDFCVTVTDDKPARLQPATACGVAVPTKVNVGAPLVVAFNAASTSPTGFPIALDSFPANSRATGWAVAASTASEPESPSPMKFCPLLMLPTSTSSLYVTVKFVVVHPFVYPTACIVRCIMSTAAQVRPVVR